MAVPMVKVSRDSNSVTFGRLCTCHESSLCVADVALGDGQHVESGFVWKGQ